MKKVVKPNLQECAHHAPFTHWPIYSEIKTIPYVPRTQQNKPLDNEITMEELKVPHKF